MSVGWKFQRVQFQMNKVFSDGQNCLEKEETPFQESEVLIAGKIPLENQQPLLKAGTSESLLKQKFSGYRPKVGRVARYHCIPNL